MCLFKTRSLTFINAALANSFVPILTLAAITVVRGMQLLQVDTITMRNFFAGFVTKLAFVDICKGLSCADYFEDVKKSKS